MKWAVLLASHALVLAIGFALGVYFLPILTAPPSPDAAMLQERAAAAEYTATFTRDLAGSDFLHWGEGTVAVSASEIVHMGALAPGPDYKLYLTAEFVEDEAGFERVRANAVQIADIKTFDGFIAAVPDGIDIAAFNTVVVWCESFGEFITAAKYR